MESFHEFYSTTEYIHKRRPCNNNDNDDANDQSNPLFDCDANDEPEYKTILIPMPIVVVERLPEIFENNNNEITAAEDNPPDDANKEKRSTSIKKRSKKDVEMGSKRKKTSKSKSVKKLPKKGRPLITIPNIEKIV